MIFTRLAHTSRPASTLAIAIALATGAAIGVTALEAPASAKEKKEKAEKPNYSKEFVAAYQPVAGQLEGETPDLEGIKAALPGVVAAAQTADDKNAVGSLLVNVGAKAQDTTLQLQGIDLMIESGKIPADKLGLYNFQAGQIAYQQDQFATAREYFEAASAAGYTENSPEIFIAETYFGEDNAAEGLNYLTGVIDARRAAGNPVDETWIKRGLAMAYNAGLKDQASKYALWYVDQYPSEQSWGDAVAILLNTGGYENPEILDLMRLARHTDTLRDDRSYLEYVDAADYRRLPAEVVAVIDEGWASGKLPKDDPYVVDTRKQAADRAAADRADIDSFLTNARKSGADLRSVMAAGDVMLSMDRPAEAEEFYTKALSMPSADTALVLTRLGIAQFDQGKNAEAEATFGKVEGNRQPIAKLWAVYSAQQSATGAT